jgi:hypothetical protein
MAIFLDLAKIKLDPELLERVPLELCQYHQALPLAREGGLVSVAMVYPHNVAACAMLAELLEAEVIPVQVDAALLQEVFERLSPLFAESPLSERPQLLPLRWRRARSCFVWRRHSPTQKAADTLASIRPM